MSPHGVTGVVIATMSAGPAWPMAAGGRRTPGVARRGVRSGRLDLPPSVPMPGHRRSARNRLPMAFCKRAKVSGQGTSLVTLPDVAGGGEDLAEVGTAVGGEAGGAQRLEGEGLVVEQELHG